MGISFVNRVSTRYRVKSGERAYFLIVCILFLLCNCSNTGTLSMAEQDELQCGFFRSRAKCTPEYLSLWKDHGVLSERLNSTMAKNEELESTITGVKAQLASCTGNYEALGNAFENTKRDLAQLKNPYTFTQRDAYVGAGSAVVGATGLWMCQKILGTKKREEPHKRVLKLEEEVKTLRENLDITDKMALLASKEEVKMLRENLDTTSKMALLASKEEVRTLRENLDTTSKMAVLTSKVAQNAERKASTALEVASRAETASKAGASAHVIPQQNNGR